MVIQGNLRPICTFTNKNFIANFKYKSFIFNPGHRVLPNIPVENVKFLVNYVREFKY